MYIRANPLRLSSAIVDLDHNFKVRREPNVLSAVAVEIGKIKSSLNNMGRSAHWQQGGLHQLSGKICGHKYFSVSFRAVNVKDQEDLDHSFDDSSASFMSSSPCIVRGNNFSTSNLSSRP